LKPAFRAIGTNRGQLFIVLNAFRDGLETERLSQLHECMDEPRRLNGIGNSRHEGLVNCEHVDWE
jgi:hypothetical protein